MSKWSLHAYKIRAYNANIKKYKFYIIKVMYLGLIIFRDGIKMDPKKVAAIIN